MERIANKIDYMIDNKIYTDIVNSIYDLNISNLFSYLNDKIQLLHNNLEFLGDLKNLLFKYRNLYINISFKSKYLVLEHENIHKYYISISNDICKFIK